MINLLKRYNLWWCRVMQHIPGLRAYGRFMERQYTKRFWTAYLTLLTLGIATQFGLMRLQRWLIARYDAETQKDLSFLEENKL